MKVYINSAEREQLLKGSEDNGKDAGEGDGVEDAEEGDGGRKKNRVVALDYSDTDNSFDEEGDDEDDVSNVCSLFVCSFAVTNWFLSSGIFNVLSI